MERGCHLHLLYGLSVSKAMQKKEIQSVQQGNVLIKDSGLPTMESIG